MGKESCEMRVFTPESQEQRCDDRNKHKNLPITHAQDMLPRFADLQRTSAGQLVTEAPSRTICRS